jgi:hypothetical protein
VQKILQAKRLIVSCPISTGRARIKVLSLTDLGKSVLGITESDADRLGGPEHRYWKKRLAEHLRGQGWQATEEYPIGGGRAIDLVAQRGDERIAFEIETGNSDAAANVEKCLAVGFERVVVVATSAAAFQTLARALSVGPRVSLLTGAEAVQRNDWQS